MIEAIIIVTGDEIVNGDIIDTNSKYYSQGLAEIGISTKAICAVRDITAEILEALNIAAKYAKVIILSGGMGPTCDDLTRFALAEHLGVGLKEDPSSIEHLKKRGELFNIPYAELHKAQALFPIGGESIENQYGTANAFYIHHNDISYFMLPGPPREAKPIFDGYICKKLKPLGKKIYRKSYKTIGLLEATIMEAFETATKHLNAKIGSRYNYPYVDCKIESSTEFTLPPTLINELFGDHFISDNGKSAIDLLSAILIEKNVKIEILESKLKVFLQSTLTNNKTIDHIGKAELKLEVTGIDEYWQELPYSGKTNCKIRIYNGATLQVEKTAEFSFRGPEVIDYAIHFAAKEMYCYLLKH